MLQVPNISFVKNEIKFNTFNVYVASGKGHYDMVPIYLDWGDMLHEKALQGAQC